jgi:hypothetical protein
MQSELRALLANDATLAALVSTRIYWNHIPQDATDPCVVMYLITGAPGVHTQGSDRLTSSIVQINVRATTVASMVSVRNAIVAKLHAFSGTQGNIVFQGIFLRDERQDSEKPDTTLYHTSQLDFDVWSGTTA